MIAILRIPSYLLWQPESQFRVPALCLVPSVAASPSYHGTPLHVFFVKVVSHHSVTLAYFAMAIASGAVGNMGPPPTRPVQPVGASARRQFACYETVTPYRPSRRRFCSLQATSAANGSVPSSSNEQPAPREGDRQREVARMLLNTQKNMLALNTSRVKVQEELAVANRRIADLGALSASHVALPWNPLAVPSCFASRLMF